MKIGQSQNTFETILPHHDWEEMKITIDHWPTEEEPTIEIETKADLQNPDRVKLTFAELERINAIVERYKAAQKLMKGTE